MGFNKVYKTLQEIFPQVDARALRAVAIEHSKDADAAVEAVLVEIIPFFTERSRPSSPSMKSISGGSSSSAAAQTPDRSMKPLSYSEVENGYNIGGSLLANHYASEGHSDEGESSTAGLTRSVKIREDHSDERESSTAGSTRSVKIHETSTEVSPDQYSQSELVLLTDKNALNTLQIEASGILEPEEISAVVQPESSTVSSPCHASESLRDVRIDEDQQVNISPEKAEHDNHLGIDSGNNQEKDQENTCPVGNSAAFTIHDPTHSSLENVDQAVSPKPLEESLSSDAASMMEPTNNIDVPEDESCLRPALSQSSQIDVMDVLQEMIEDARNHKKTLSDAKESVISLLKEVELKELAAKQAEDEAASGEMEIWVKVEELKQMLQHAKGANDMHAGDVYAEKSVLTTELRELRSRVLSMTDERDKYLTLLDKMHQTLEERLATAENKITSAEHEMQRRERTAREALAEQELIMEKVVAESNILKQQAEENTKLREFLVDRGRFLDTLQGEINVIYQDITLLKEKYDENVPFSSSLFSSHSSGFLGSSRSSLKSLDGLSLKSGTGGRMEHSSSGSSLKSMSRDPVDLSSSGTPSLRSVIQDQVEVGFDQAEDQNKTNAGAGRCISEEEAREDRKALIEDGWDFFDSREIDA